MSADQRRHPRFTINQAMTIEFAKEQNVDCTGVNLSESGLLMETDSHLQVYDRLFIMFTIPEETVITIEAIVMRVDKKGKKFLVAVEIAEIKPEDKKLLKKYLKKFSE